MFLDRKFKSPDTVQWAYWRNKQKKYQQFYKKTQHSHALMRTKQ